MFEVNPIAAALGAELHGVDLCQDLSPEIYAEIRRLLIEHQVIFFRDQDISSACLLYTSPSPRDRTRSRMPSSA